LTIAGSATFAVALALVYVWPRSHLSIQFVLLATFIGASAAILCGLTYWHKARIQIGKLKQRYRRIRRVAALVTLVGLAPLLVREASLWTIRTPPEQSRGAAPLAIAIPHLQGDDSHRIEQQLERALGELGPDLPLQIRTIDKIVAPRELAAVLDFSTMSAPSST
jgi:hypothetical protein